MEELLQFDSSSNSQDSSFRLETTDRYLKKKKKPATPVECFVAVNALLLFYCSC